MKIYGSNQTNFNPYKNQMQKPEKMNKGANQKDQLEISNQAKLLQEGGKINAKREAYVEGIKSKIQSGSYQVNAEKTAQKMIDFWSKQ